MADAETASRLRQQLSSCRQSKGFRQYPEGLRREAAAYVGARRGQGVKLIEIASELGVAITTADAWSRLHEQSTRPTSVPRQPRTRETSGLSLVPVVVGPEPTRRMVSRLEVEFADGTRLHATGVGPEDLVRAIEALRRGG